MLFLSMQLWSLHMYHAHVHAACFAFMSATLQRLYLLLMRG